MNAKKKIRVENKYQRVKRVFPFFKLLLYDHIKYKDIYSPLMYIKVQYIPLFFTSLPYLIEKFRTSVENRRRIEKTGSTRFQPRLSLDSSIAIIIPCP